MDEKEYGDLKQQIESGKVVQYGGRTASTVEELDAIKDMPDLSAVRDYTAYDHGTSVSTQGLPAQDEVGQRAQPFTPEVVQANKPSADEPGPTSLNATPATDDTDSTDGEGNIPPSDDETDGRGYTKEALLSIAKERGIDVPARATKAEITALLDAS